MAVHRIANTPIKKIGFFDAEWPERPPGWYCKIRRTWHKVPRGQKTELLKKINKGKVPPEDVAILRLSDVDDGLVATYAYYCSNWYQITGETQAFDDVEVTTFVKERCEKIRRNIKRANDEPSAEGSPRNRDGDRRRSIPRSVQREVWRRDGGACIECGSNKRLEYDHIIPYSKGGADTVRNIQLLCEVCNRAKSNRVGG
mgnify:CR=1 FL=1